MADTSETETLAIFELLRDPANRADPYPAYEQIRAKGRFVRTPFDVLIATSHDDVASLLRDPRFSSNNRHQAGRDQLQALAAALGLGDLFELMERVMLFADPPDHTRLRRIVGKAFTMRTVEDMRPRIAALVDSLLDQMAEAGGGDLVEGLAFPLPVAIISEMLGVPAADHELLRGWTALAVKALDPSDNPMELLPSAEAIRSIRAYFHDLVEERRQSLGDDLLSAFIQAEDEGEKLSHDELLDTTVLLFGAGHETTVNLITGGVLNLLRHPDQLARLGDDPSLIGSAVEELLRFGPPVQMTSRIATADVELNGQTFAQGTQLIALIAAANRDPRLFDDPARLDIGRSENRHLSFGGGIHLCLGAPLARVEGQESIGRLVRRFPAVALATDEVEWKSTTTIRGPAALPLTV